MAVSEVVRRSGFAFFLLAAVILGPEIARAQVSPTTSASISGSVSDSTGKPVANAKVSLSGPKSATTQTDANGLFVFVGVPYGDYLIAVAAAGLGTATRTVSVQGDTNIAIEYKPATQNGLRVIANVSSSASAAFNVTPASVTQVNPIADAFKGRTSWRTILEQIPGVSQAGYGNGNAGFVGALPDGPLEPMQISINGALPYETATLVDEMPLINNGGNGTNLGQYPLNGFGSADVVRGPGANAPSIVDSIGGSFELHPMGTVSSNHYDLSVSTDPYGGIVSNALAAVRWRNLSVVATDGVNSSPGPLSGSSIPGCLYTLTYGYFQFPSPLQIDGHTVTAFYGNNFQPLYKPGYANPPYGSYYGSVQSVLGCCVDQTTAWNQHSGSIALNYAISPTVSAGVFYAGEISEQAGTPITCSIDFAPPPGYSGSVPAGLALFHNNGLFGAYFQTQSAGVLEEKVTAEIGHGTLRVAALQNRSYQGNDALQCSPETQTLRLYGGAYLDGSPTPTVFNGGTYTLTGPYTCRKILSSSNNRDMMAGYTTPLGQNIHAGASFVESYYDNPSGYYQAFSGPGAPSFVESFQTTTGSGVSQTTREGRVFIGGDPSAKTSVDLSMYFVALNYHVPNPDVSGTYTDANFNYSAPRLGFVWRPTPSVALRASAGGGFAEAPLGDLVGSNGVPQLNSPQNNAYTVSVTNLHLQPEKSFAFDLGTDIRWHGGSIVSFDVYRSNLYGQVYGAATLTGTYLGLPLYTFQNGNLGESRYEGVLVDVRHDSAARGIYWTLSGGFTRAYVISVPKGFYDSNPPLACDFATNTNCSNQQVVLGPNFNGSFTASIPYASGLGRLGYRWEPGKYVSLAATYYGNNNTYYRPAFIEVDGEAGYPVTKNMSLVAIFRNITGVYDSGQQVFSADNITTGAPTVAGPPNVLYGEAYGPRTVLLTAQFHL